MVLVRANKKSLKIQRSEFVNRKKNGQKKKDKKTNNYLQNTTQKTKD